jgi:hypothetical protein
MGPRVREEDKTSAAFAGTTSRDALRKNHSRQQTRFHHGLVIESRPVLA